MRVKKISVVILGICLSAVLQEFDADAKGNIPKDYPIGPVPFTDVELTDEFWAPRIETNRKVSIPYAFGKCEETGRIDNFAIAGGLMEGEHRANFPFDDTDPYKILEGAAYSLSVHPDPKLDKFLDELIVKIAAAQEDDGYLFTCRTNKAKNLFNWYGEKRWSKLGGSHELYNMGHLYEAAVAHYEATGKRTLLDVAIKNADFLDTVFGPGRNETAPGHQIIEMGLARLYRATGNEKYLNLAKFYLDTRGPGGSEYNQSHEKAIEQSEAVGHAVRASYMYCGMADVAALTGDRSYLEAIDRIWENVVTKKLYLTGGIGATGSGEAFAKNYELPNATAYCETCAAIGNVMWNHRMFLFHGDAKYVDVLERTLYNGLISGVSLEGDSFFYPNPLASQGQHKRSPWFPCACCPGNITRFVSSVPGYIYAQEGDNLYVNLFAGGTGTVTMKKNPVQIRQQTRYPWDGAVKMTVEPKQPAKLTICVRIPGWAQNKCMPSDLYRYKEISDEKVSLKLNGETIPLKMEKGFARINRKWSKGDIIELNLPMPVRRALCHEDVADNVGKVALERGPIVYCAEWPDNNGHVLNVVLPDEARLTSEYRKEMFNGVTIVRAKAVGLSYAKDSKTALKKPQDFVAIPYYAWAHRGAGEMAVWLARNASAAEPVTPAGMIRNPSFEKALGNEPAGWKTQTYGGKADFKYSTDSRSGKRSVMIASEEGADAGWLTTVIVKPHSQYRLSAWIKTENLVAGSGKGALLNLHNIQPLQTPAVAGTKDWTQVELVFDSGDNAAVQINCLFGGWGLATGKAWFDDLGLELLSTKMINPAVKIDANKTAEPISKYIYGQFIEHLGRCIYGGIWAEMLEDRKFYFPITPNYDPYRRTRGVPQDNPFAIVGASPWQIIGPADSVAMVKEDSFVGEHTPLIQRGSGIRQLDLGLVKNKQYVGYIYLKPQQQSTNVKISLLWGDKPQEQESIHTLVVAGRYGKYPFKFTAGADTSNGKLEIEVDKIAMGPCLVGTVSLMPADNIDGMRADTLGLLKELNSPMYRWPGGNFVSGYDWRDGIGDRDRREPRKNPAWTGVEHNDFGFNEFVRFCRLLDTEPLVTVNTGFGDAYSAAAQLEYSNGSADTLMGSLRAQNGEPGPFNIRYWAIGNEMFGDWQLGYMKLEHYVQKHNWVVDKMREVDPDIIPIASGNAGSWSEGLLKDCSNHIDMIAEHFYCREKSSLVEHTSQIANNIKQKVEFHQQLRQKLDSLKGKDIRIAMTEWNYWYGPYLFGELGTRYFHKDALGIAKGLHEYFRHSDIIFLANYAQTVNVIGCIKTTKTDAAFETTGLALKLYRNHFGTVPVAVTGDAYPLDVAAAWTSDHKALTVAIVNPTEQEHELPVDLEGVRLSGRGRLWLIANEDPMAYNEPGKKPRVKIVEKTIDNISSKLEAPALSISLYLLPVK
ncbi:MAG TPA: beta-L-arabinofuranosidase domain-containing protein [Sedimentisphaerales bacterium]|nr:beta-L-arabinofuranosidase domain-containing protein [Sedimentisphaerales bacterium]